MALDLASAESPASMWCNIFIRARDGYAARCDGVACCQSCLAPEHDAENQEYGGKQDMQDVAWASGSSQKDTRRLDASSTVVLLMSTANPQTG